MSGTVQLSLTVNGGPHDLVLDVRVSLLDCLRDHVGVTGPKKGCNQGACGACSIIADGRRINSCLAFAAQYDGAVILTVEGLGSVDHLHPLQAAFIAHEAFQCGYCTAGQLCSAVAMLAEVDRGDPSWISETLGDPGALTRDEIRERMSGNLCRCGAYNGIVDAIAGLAPPR